MVVVVIATLMEADAFFTGPPTCWRRVTCIQIKQPIFLFTPAYTSGAWEKPKGAFLCLFFVDGEESWAIFKQVWAGVYLSAAQNSYTLCQKMFVFIFLQKQKEALKKKHMSLTSERINHLLSLQEFTFIPFPVSV